MHPRHRRANQARATVEQRQRELASKEGKASFGAQIKLLTQSVASALAQRDSPRALRSGADPTAGVARGTREPLLELREAVRTGSLGALVGRIAQERYDEGYTRGVHDQDATKILERLLAMRDGAGRLSVPAPTRPIGRPANPIPTTSCSASRTRISTRASSTMTT